MKVLTKLVFLDEQNEKFFGEGPYRLFTLVEETGSLRGAAISMGMAYTKALRILKNTENALGFAMTERVIGGKNGGGSRLTAEGKAWLRKYEEYREACRKANESLYREFFPRLGCVIMASGMGKRFGGNKLMADFGGKALICRALEATEGLFERRVVVTRHRDVAELCRSMKIDVIEHDLPHRSDTVRMGLARIGDADGCMFCQGDQPLLRRDSAAKLIGLWQENREYICRAAFGETEGSPVIFPSWAFAQLCALPEGSGGSAVIDQYPERVKRLQLRDEFELMDADTPQQLELLLKYIGGQSYDG